MQYNPNCRLAELTDQDWKNIIKRLRNYAQIKCRILPCDLEPADIACDALKRALDGTRVWNVEAYPDFFDFLQGIVDSIMSEILKGKRHRLMIRDRVANETALEKYAETISDDAENCHGFDYWLQEITKVCEGDDDLEQFYLAVDDGNYSIKDIASYLEWDIKKTYRVKDRLKRKIADKNEEEQVAGNE